MHNARRLISVIMMFFAAFAMVASSALPHHHHDDGSICIILEKESTDEGAHSHGHNSCDDDCAMNIDLLQDASQLGHASNAGFIPTLVAILSWDNSQHPEPQEFKTSTSFIYIERAINDIVCSTYGLRAPPFVA